MTNGACLFVVAERELWRLGPACTCSPEMALVPGMVSELDIKVAHLRVGSEKHIVICLGNNIHKIKKQTIKTFNYLIIK